MDSNNKVYWCYVNTNFVIEFSKYEKAIEWARLWFKTNPRTRFDSITIKEMIINRPTPKVNDF